MERRSERADLRRTGVLPQRNRRAACLGFYSGLYLERQYDLSKETFSGWLSDQAKSFAIGVTLTIVAAELVYGFISLVTRSLVAIGRIDLYRADRRPHAIWRRFSFFRFSTP